jgi:hypothetical protein
MVRLEEFRLEEVRLEEVKLEGIRLEGVRLGGVADEADAADELKTRSKIRVVKAKIPEYNSSLSLIYFPSLFLIKKIYTEYF